MKKKNINEKIRLVSTLVICSLFIVVAFSSVLGKSLDKQNQMSEEEKGSDPYIENEQRNTGFFNFRILNRDWNYWSNKPNLFTIPTGNVGIGTDSPQATLDICDYDEPTELRLSSGISGGSCSINFANSGWEIQSIMDSPPMTLNFRYGENKVMTLCGTNVGIGTTNPVGSLSIEGLLPTDGNITFFDHNKADIIYDGGSDDWVIFDHRGSYQAAFFISIIMALIAVFCSVLIKERRYHVPQKMSD